MTPAAAIAEYARRIRELVPEMPEPEAIALLDATQTEAMDVLASYGNSIQAHSKDAWHAFLSFMGDIAPLLPVIGQGIGITQAIVNLTK